MLTCELYNACNAYERLMFVALTVLFHPPHVQPPAAVPSFFASGIAAGVGIGVTTELAVPFMLGCWALMALFRPSNLAFISSSSCRATASAVFALTSSKSSCSLSAGVLLSFASTGCMAREDERLLKVNGGCSRVDFWDAVRPRRSSLSPLVTLSDVVLLLSVGVVLGDVSSADVQVAAAEVLRALCRRSLIVFSCL